MGFVMLFIGAVLLNLFAFITIRLRPKIFKVKIFKPMLVNFKLSIIPLGILALNLFAAFVFRSLPRIVFFAGLFLWLLFLPNAAYLITELNLTHRAEDEKEVPIWYDIVSVLSFALSGIVNTLLNIVLIQFAFIIYFDPPQVSAADHFILFSSGFGILLLMVIGVYLGRSIRFNSWDIVHIGSFVKKLRNHFSGKGVFSEFVLYVVFNTVFFMIMYVAFGIPSYLIA
jgi:uncharacterized membrane protein